MEEVGLTVRPIQKIWDNVAEFKLHWRLAEYVGGELTPNLAEVSDARWLRVDEICRMDGTFEGDREFYRDTFPCWFPQASSRLVLCAQTQQSLRRLGSASVVS